MLTPKELENMLKDIMPAGEIMKHSEEPGKLPRTEYNPNENAA